MREDCPRLEEPFMARVGYIFVGCIFLMAYAFSAYCATDLCVQVTTSPDDQDNLQKLVHNELGHHPSHVVVQEDCESRLKVELFELKGMYYLTARMNQAVPVRYQFRENQELSAKLRTAIRQVLAHDPIFLMNDITRYSAIQRAAHSVLKRGHNTIRLELYQGIGRGNEQAVYAPGAAVGMTRGADHWQVFARMYFGSWPGKVLGESYVLRVDTGADLGLIYEFNKLDNSSLYVGAGFGLQYMRYEGRSDPTDAKSIDHRNDFGPTFHLRLGFRLMRLYDFDCDFFVVGYLPMFGADKDSRLADFYSPTLQLGLGIGF